MSRSGSTEPSLPHLSPRSPRTSMSRSGSTEPETCTMSSSIKHRTCPRGEGRTHSQEESADPYRQGSAQAVITRRHSHSSEQGRRLVAVVATAEGGGGGGGVGVGREVAARVAATEEEARVVAREEAVKVVWGGQSRGTDTRRTTARQAAAGLRQGAGLQSEQAG